MPKSSSFGVPDASTTMFAGFRSRCRIRRPCRLEEPAARILGGEQRLRLRAQIGIAGAGLGQPRTAARGIEFERAGDNLLEALPALGGHVSARLSHRRATFQSRFTVAGD